MKTERRTLNIPDCLARMETREDGTKVFRGLAAVFYDGTPETEFRLWEDYVERVAPGAFDGVISQDVRCLVNHDQNIILGRTAAKTLALSVTERGLQYEVPFDEADPDHVKWGRKLDKGNVTGSSFSFIVADGGSAVSREASQTVRTITKLDTLYDTGPVTFPAYTGTSAGVATRDADGAREDLERFKAETEEPPAEPRNDTDRLDIDLDLMKKRMATD